jgi:tripartite-type tricarboxylate transporter receptor subunit TctC
LLNSILDVKPTLVPFNGRGPAINAVIGGQVDYLCGDVAASVSQLQAGTIKAYAVGTAERNPMLPDVPTSKEAGLPEFQASAWNALFAPKLDFGRFRRREREHFPCAAKYGTEFLYCLGLAGT